MVTPFRRSLAYQLTGALICALALLGVDSARAAGGGGCGPAQSNFSSGSEGWTVSGAAGPVKHIGSGGDPGGYVSVDATVGGEAAYWEAPCAYLGDQRDAYNGRLNFSLRQAQPTGRGSIDEPNMILEGNGLKLVDYIRHPATDWLQFTPLFSEDSGWVNAATDLPATKRQFKRVLRSLDRLAIRAEYRDGAAANDLDSVNLRKPKGNGCPPGYSPGALEQQGGLNRGCLINGYRPGDPRCSQSAGGIDAGLPPCLTGRLGKGQRSNGNGGKGKGNGKGNGSPKLVVRQNGVRKIGDFRPRRNATLRAAKRALGQPNRVNGVGGGSCEARWRKLGLRVLFSSSGKARHSCRRGKAEAQYAALRGPQARKWRTNKGLRVGDSRKKLKRTYKQARRGPSIYVPDRSRGRGFELVHGRLDGDSVAWLGAEMRRGKVKGFEMFVAGAIGS